MGGTAVSDTQETPGAETGHKSFAQEAMEAEPEPKRRGFPSP
jgi:hypothetical protein